MRIFYSALILFVSCPKIFSYADINLQIDKSHVISIDTTLKSGNALLTDSLTVSDTLRQIIQIDTLVPMQYKGLTKNYQYKTITSKDEIHQLDYRYTGNFFSDMPFGYLKDFGWLGQPNEIMLYGLGFGNISFLQDGTQINNRLQNSFDANQIQSEYIDSVEVLPLPIGFLYETLNNPVTINIITRDRISPRPYTRIRFYQAPQEEGFIDAIFNAYLMSRLNLTFEITNNTVDPRYDNSNYSGWKASSKLRYMPNNWLNIIGSYSYVKSEVHLNGGVDYEFIQSNYPSNEVSDLLYNSLDAPVIYSDRYQKKLQHNFNLKILGNIFEQELTDLNIYYQQQLIEFRQNEKNDLVTQGNVPSIIHDNNYNSFGVLLRQSLSLNLLQLDLMTNYEKIKYSAGVLKTNTTKSLFSFSGKASMPLADEMIIPSGFIKYLKYSSDNFFGWGTDLNFTMTDNLYLYAGYSKYKKPLNIIEEQYFSPSNPLPAQNITTAQVTIKYKHENINADVSVFRYSNDSSLNPVIDKQDDSLVVNEVGFYITEQTELTGMNISLSFKIWKILLKNNTSFYTFKADEQKYSLPKLISTGGIYFVDTLFNSNLKLKTGFNYYVYGKRGFEVYDFEKSISANYYIDNVTNTPALINTETSSTSFQIDFFLAGQIQKSAIVYFVFENLLDQKYYLIPHYPMFGRAVRFGLAWEFLD